MSNDTNSNATKVSNDLSACYQSRVEADADDSAAVWNEQQLLERCLGNLELAERLVRRFESEFPEKIQQLQTLAEEESAEGFSRLAHQLKGAASTLAASRLTIELAQVEALSRQGQLAHSGEMLERVNTEFLNLQTKLRTFNS